MSWRYYIACPSEVVPAILRQLYKYRWCTYQKYGREKSACAQLQVPQGNKLNIMNGVCAHVAIFDVL